MSALFPQPDLVINGNALTKKRTVRVWCAARAGSGAPETLPDDDEYMSNRQIRQFFGNISAMTLWRWRAHGVSDGKRALGPNRGSKEEQAAA